MTQAKKKSFQLGLWIPKKILKLPCLSGDDKIYYAYIYSFGERGCWQTDEQIGKALGRSDRTIQRYQANCKKAGLLKVIGKNSKYRKIWAKDHPKYKTWRKKIAILLRQDRQSRTTKPSELLRQNCPTTNKYTNKGTNKESGGSPSPADSQAHAPQANKQQQLEAYKTKEETTNSIEQLKNSFGYGARRRTPEQTPAEREQRRQEQQRALLAVKAAEKG